FSSHHIPTNMEKHSLEKCLRRFRMANVGYIFISDFCLEFIQSCGDWNWVRSVVMYLSNTKTHVLAGTLEEGIFPTSLLLENGRKKSHTFLCVCYCSRVFFEFFLHYSNQ